MNSRFNILFSQSEAFASQRASCRSASYTVRMPRPLKLQAGIRTAALIQLLTTHNVSTAAIMTACNPFGRKLSAAQNKTRHSALAAAIKSLKLDCLPAERHHQDDGESAEAGYLLLNISGAQAEVLLIEFEQHALLWCNQSGTPELMLHPALRRR